MIPSITDERLQQLATSIRHVIARDGRLIYTKTPENLRGMSFLYDPDVNDFADDLETLVSIPTRHTCGHPSLFKPTFAEVLAQIPEQWIAETAAFRTYSPVAREGADGAYHEALTTLFRRPSRVDRMKQQARYAMLSKNPESQAAAIARHYAGQASRAMRLLQMTDLMQHLDGPQRELSRRVADEMAREIKDAHREDLGLPLAWGAEP